MPPRRAGWGGRSRGQQGGDLRSADCISEVGGGQPEPGASWASNSLTGGPAETPVLRALGCRGGDRAVHRHRGWVQQRWDGEWGPQWSASRVLDSPRQGGRQPGPLGVTKLGVGPPVTCSGGWQWGQVDVWARGTHPLLPQWDSCSLSFSEWRAPVRSYVGPWLACLPH